MRASTPVITPRGVSKKQTCDIGLKRAYAELHKQLKLNDTIPINDKTFTIVGLANPALAGQTADIYFPLGTLQELATKQSRVNTVLVKAQDAGSGIASDVTTARRDIDARDRRDRERAIAPLRPAADAIVIDNSALTPEMVVARMLETVRTRARP